MKYVYLILLLTFGCQSYKVDNQLKPFVLNKIKGKVTGVVDFRKFNGVNWNKMYVLGPYANPAFFDKTLSKFASEIKNTGLEMHDDISLVILIQDEELASLNVFQRNEGDFSETYKIGISKKFTYYKKNESIFDFGQAPNGLIGFKLHK